MHFYPKDALPEPIYEGRPDWIALYYKAWELAFKHVDPVNKEGWKPILTCMPGVGITWLWDSCFMTLITNYANGTLSAFNNLDNFYALRRESDGFISMAYDIKNGQPAYGERINPPLLAWAEWEHFLISGDRVRFESVLPAIEGLYAFIEKHRRRNCELYYFEDTGSSGMDNAPRSGYAAYDLNGSDVCFVDLACQQALSAKSLAAMHRVLGNEENVRFYAAEQNRINKLINGRHYSEKNGFYYDFFSRGNPQDKVKLINTKTAAAFWTLLCGAAQGNALKQVVSHLMNPTEFYTHTPFASLSRDDLNYDPTGGYWLGSAWHPTTFVAIRGLYENGYAQYAYEASVKYLNVMSEVALDPRYGSIWECYSPAESKPATREDGTLVRPEFVGWGGLGPITVLIEQIIGLHFNALENTILFEVTNEGASGIRNMNFNGGKVALTCMPSQHVLNISCEKPFILKLKLPEQDVKIFTISKGNHIIDL